MFCIVALVVSPIADLPLTAVKRVTADVHVCDFAAQALFVLPHSLATEFLYTQALPRSAFSDLGSLSNSLRC